MGFNGGGLVALAQEVREDDGRWFADEQKILKFTLS